jgi:ribonuclease HI
MSAAGPPQGANDASGGKRVRTRAVTIYTDGACKGNPGPGGWGALLVAGDRVKEIYGGELATTNNRMELTAVIRALESLTRDCDVDLFTDSQYVKQGIEDWIHGWKRNGWKTADRKPVKNAELWRELEQQAARHRVRWHWVRGHSEDAGNERADALANRGVEEVRGSVAR